MKTTPAMNKIMLSALLICMIAFLSNPQPVSGNAISTRLENGLEVIMLENHSAPLVSVFVAIKAGAAHETYRQNGLTHFLEHMLFNGTENFTQKELYDEMDLIGGYNNAYTRKDYTVFMITTPSRNIERGMEIQSDMLFNSVFPEEKVKKEIGIVSEEINRDYSNPRHIMDRNFKAWLFNGTPFEKSILGTVASVNNFTAEDVEDYWRTYYSPNNMTMIVIGDFCPSKMVDILNEYYGQSLPADLPESKRLDYPILKNKRKIEYIKGVTPAISIVFNAPSPHDQDYFSFSLAVDLLNDKLDEYLRNLNPNDPVRASVSLIEHEICSRMVVSAKIPEKSTYEDTEKQLINALKETLSQPTDQDKLNAAKISAIALDARLRENSMMFGAISVGDIAMWGWDWYENKSAMIEKITVDDFNRVKQSILAFDARQTYVALTLPETDTQTAKSEIVTVKKTLPNGLTVAVMQDDSSEIFGMHLLVKNRCYLEPEGKDGIAHLLHRTLTKGTVSSTGDEIEFRLASIGADIKTNDWGFVPFDDYYLDPEYSYVRLTSLDRFWKESIDLLNELVSEDGLSEEILKSIRKAMAMESMPQSRMPSKVASIQFKDKMISGSPLNRPIMGSTQSLGMISLDDLHGFRNIYLAPENMLLTFVKGEDASEVIEYVEKSFGKIG